MPQHFMKLILYLDSLDSLSGFASMAFVSLAIGFVKFCTMSSPSSNNVRETILHNLVKIFSIRMVATEFMMFTSRGFTRSAK